MTRLESAILFALEAHSGQLDKSNELYVLHPLAVMLSVSADEDTRLVAVLHDVVEDCDVTVEEIFLRFGGAVAEAVDALSRRKDELYEQYIQRCSQNPIAREVKIADLNHNLSRMRKLPIKHIPRLKAKYEAALETLRQSSLAS